MDSLRKFFEDERNRREKEAASIMPAGDLIAAMIRKQRGFTYRKRLMSRLLGGVGFVFVAAASIVYFREFVAEAFLWIKNVAGQVSGKIAEIYANTKPALLSWSAGISGTAETGIIEKATSEISGWPVQIWYMVFLAAGVGLLLGADRLIRSRKSF